MRVCTDPCCKWARLDDARHFERHNPPCAQLVSGERDGLCGLMRDHSGPHVPVVREP